MGVGVGDEPAGILVEEAAALLASPVVDGAALSVVESADAEVRVAVADSPALDVTPVAGILVLLAGFDVLLIAAVEFSGVIGSPPSASPPSPVIWEPERFAIMRGGESRPLRLPVVRRF
jgi:hypothetical protein